MKFSKFNFIYKSERHKKYFLYNLVSNVLLGFDDNTFSTLKEAIEDPTYLNLLPEKDKLIESKIFVKNDATIIDQKKIEVLQRRFNKNIFDLTLAPTLGCNLNCSYCFQHDLSKNTMKESTMLNLLKFLKGTVPHDVKQLRITWFGGEPLLAFDKMRFICENLQAQLKVPFESHIITNGYLMSESVINQFNDLNVKFVQVTVDGLKSIHDRRRPLHNGEGSFDKILENISTLNKLEPSIEVALRINVDMENSSDYGEAYWFLRERFKDKLHIYPGFVDDYTYGCSSVNNCIMDRRNRGEFILNNYYRNQIYSNLLLPVYNINSCMVRYLNSYVVGPHGDIYKCLSNIGVEEMQIGNINNHDQLMTNKDLLVAYLKGDDYIENQKCNSCELFTICDGGCPYLVMMRKDHIRKYDNCHVAKGRLEEFIDAHIDSKSQCL